MFRRSLIAAVAVVISFGIAAPAWAHVTVNPGEAAKGGFTKLTFRVPNERDDAATVKVEVAFPADHPIAFVSVKPHPGWTASVEQGELPKPIEVHGEPVTEAVTRITWTADSDASAVKAGQFEEFDVSAGPLPDDTDSLVFKALQTYSSGEVVRWIEEPSGDDEPEHPAPILTLTAATGDDHHATATTVAGDHDDTAGEAADDSSDDSGGDDSSTKALAIVGIGLGAAGLALGLAALNTARRKAPSDADS